MYSECSSISSTYLHNEYVVQMYVYSKSVIHVMGIDHTLGFILKLTVSNSRYTQCQIRDVMESSKTVPHRREKVAE